MSDPEQTDLVDYLAAEETRAIAQPAAMPGSTGTAMACVRYERAFLQRVEPALERVQNEHGKPASRIESGDIDAEPNPAVKPMSPRRLLVCLSVIGWSGHELARRTGRPQTTVRRWTTGETPMPADVAAWVEMLAALHRAHPAPRAGQGLPE